ncbi:hypothetical protein BVRB_5g102220 [Beta vulgaris subsp. vulgaris]|nr:hypothetical protein BVRB_5g102220 [Beta vulgaris subsp. vulgaris]
MTCSIGVICVISELRLHVQFKDYMNFKKKRLMGRSSISYLLTSVGWLPEAVKRMFVLLDRS